MSDRLHALDRDNQSPVGKLIGRVITGLVVVEDIRVGAGDRWSFLAEASVLTGGNTTFLLELIIPDPKTDGGVINLGAVVPDDVNSTAKVALPDIVTVNVAVYQAFDRLVPAVGTAFGGKTLPLRYRLTITPATNVTLSSLSIGGIDYGR